MESAKLNNMKKTKIFFILVFTLLMIVGVNNLVSSKRRKSKATSCFNTIDIITRNGRLWAQEHAGRFPTNFFFFSIYNIPYELLVCPSDNKSKVHNWANLSETNCTYRLNPTMLYLSVTNDIFVYCPIHRHIGFYSGEKRTGTKAIGICGTELK